MRRFRKDIKFIGVRLKIDKINFEKRCGYWDSFLNYLGRPHQDLTAAEVEEKLKFGKHPMILDVRQPDEFRQGHSPGAKLIPLNELHRGREGIAEGT